MRAILMSARCSALSAGEPLREIVNDPLARTFGNLDVIEYLAAHLRWNEVRGQFPFSNLRELRQRKCANRTKVSNVVNNLHIRAIERIVRMTLAPLNQS
jgi:hypothetical protein